MVLKSPRAAGLTCPGNGDLLRRASFQRVLDAVESSPPPSASAQQFAML